MRRAVFSLAIVSGAICAAPAQAGGFLQDLFSQPQRVPTIIYRYAPAQPQMRFIYDEGLRVSRRPGVARPSVKDRQLVLQRRIAKKKIVAQRSKLKKPDRHLAHTGVQPAGLKITAALQPALCCKNGEDPSKLIHADTTLRAGDAYMTPQGLRIYRGRGDGPTVADFVDYRKSGIGQEMKARLSALEDRRARGASSVPASSSTPRPNAAAAKPIPAQTVVGLQHSSPLRPPVYGPVATKVARTSLDPNGRVIRVVGP